jgi:hypothetical protein
MTALAARAQLGVLTRRYWAVMLGDPLPLVFLVLQAPFIGWLCTLVWGSVETETPSLYFVLCLSAVWFGLINACREVVRERAIVERERIFGLSLLGYVGSKLGFLGVLAAVQVVLLQGAVEFQMNLKGAMLVEMLALWGAAMVGTALGLLVSALAKRQASAVGAIPLLMLPQILFSEMALPAESFSDLVAAVERFMPVHWAFVVFQELAALETDGWRVVGAFLALPAMAAVFAGLTALALLRRQET